MHPCNALSIMYVRAHIEFRESSRQGLNFSLNNRLELSMIFSDVVDNFQGNPIDASSEKEIIKNDFFFVSDKRICIENTTYSLQNISSVNLSEFLHKPNTHGLGTTVILILMGIGILSLGGFAIILGIGWFLFLYFLNTLEQKRVKSETYTLFNVIISDSSGQKNVFRTRSREDAELLVRSINQAMVIK
jgi:Family of unknown function (DUF6232)